MRCAPAAGETAGEADLLCRWPGCETRRSSSKWTARDWRKSCAASSNRSTRRTPRWSARSSGRTPTWPSWWKTRTPRSAGSVSCSSGRARRRPKPWWGGRPGSPRPPRRVTPGPIPGRLPARGTATDRTSGGLQGSRTQRRRGLPGRLADRRAAPVAHRRRRVSGLHSGHRLRQGPGRAGADHRAAAAGGEGLPVAETALPSVRPGLHRARPRRGRREEVRRHGRQHDRAPEIRQRAAVQPPRWPAGEPGGSSAGLDPVGHRAGRRGGPRSGVRGVDPAGGAGGRAAQR